MAQLRKQADMVNALNPMHPMKQRRRSRCLSTPLRELIEAINPSYWQSFVGITLSPALGFNCSLTFNNLGQLHQWLGGRQRRTSMPYLNWRSAHFFQPISLDVLLEHCAQVPPANMIATINQHLPPYQKQPKT